MKLHLTEQCDSLNYKTTLNYIKWKTPKQTGKSSSQSYPSTLVPGSSKVRINRSESTRICYFHGPLFGHL